MDKALKWEIVKLCLFVDENVKRINVKIINVQGIEQTYDNILFRDSLEISFEFHYLQS